MIQHKPRPAGQARGVMIWTDGHGREWQVDAGPEVINLRSGDDSLRLERAAWTRDVRLSSTGQSLIARFYGPDFEVGFLLSQEQAREFLSRIGVALRDETAGGTPPAPARRREGSTWPQMTVVLIVVVRVRSRKTVAMAHVRTMCTVALVLAIGGMAISALASYDFMRANSDRLDTLTGRMTTGDMKYSYGAIGAAIVVVLLSLSIHECGHAISAWWCGDDFARTLGRVTLNPFAHIDLFGTVILPLLLAIGNAPIFGYAKPVPVRLDGIRRYRRAHILISLAGPGANLFLSAVALALYLAMGCLLARWAPDAEITGFSSIAPQVIVSGIAGGRLLAAVALVLKLAFMINLFLAFFNLIPIPPLDGSWVLEHLFPNTLGRVYAVIRPYGFLIFLALFWTRAFHHLLVPMWYPLLAGHGMVAACTGL